MSVTPMNVKFEFQDGVSLHRAYATRALLFACAYA